MEKVRYYFMSPDQPSPLFPCMYISRSLSCKYLMLELGFIVMLKKKLTYFAYTTMIKAKLEAYGFNRNSLTLILSYLTNRNRQGK